MIRIYPLFTARKCSMEKICLPYGPPPTYAIGAILGERSWSPCAQGSRSPYVSSERRPQISTREVNFRWRVTTARRIKGFVLPHARTKFVSYNYTSLRQFSLFLHSHLVSGVGVLLLDDGRYILLCTNMRRMIPTWNLELGMPSISLSTDWAANQLLI